MTQYEFNASQNRSLGSLARRTQWTGILIAANGLLRLAVTWGRGLDEGLTLTVVIFLLIVAFNIVGGIVFYRPHDNFARMVRTQGNDIGELMTAMHEWSEGFNILRFLLVVVIVLVVVDAVLRFAG